MAVKVAKTLHDICSDDSELFTNFTNLENALCERFQKTASPAYSDSDIYGIYTLILTRLATLDSALHTHYMQGFIEKFKYDAGFESEALQEKYDLTVELMG